VTRKLSGVFVRFGSRFVKKEALCWRRVKGSATQYQEFNWKFAPLVYPEFAPIVKNLGGIKFDFANPDTLNNGIKKDTAQVLPIFQENWRTSRN
jgi:hypothetical protein